MTSTIDKNLLIICSSEQEAFKVLDYLENNGESVSKESFKFQSDRWFYVGFYITHKVWTIASADNIYFGSEKIQAYNFRKQHSKEECPLIPGQWYKLSSGTSNLNGDWWIKFKEIGPDKDVLAKEYISGKKLYSEGCFGSIKSYTYTPIDLNEIQEFLPEGHPDKLSQKKLTKEDLIPGEIYVYDDRWISTYPEGPAYHFEQKAYDKNPKWMWTLNTRHATPQEKVILKTCIIKESSSNLKNSSKILNIRDSYIEVDSQQEADLVFDKLESLGEPVKRNLLKFIKGSWNKIQYNIEHRGWVCSASKVLKPISSKEFLKDWKVEPVYAIVGDPIAKSVENKPLIEPVHSVSVNLSTKKKTNKFKI